MSCQDILRNWGKERVYLTIPRAVVAFQWNGEEHPDIVREDYTVYFIRDNLTSVPIPHRDRETLIDFVTKLFLSDRFGCLACYFRKSLEQTLSPNFPYNLPEEELKSRIENWAEFLLKDRESLMAHYTPTKEVIFKGDWLVRHEDSQTYHIYDDKDFKSTFQEGQILNHCTSDDFPRK